MQDTLPNSIEQHPSDQNVLNTKPPETHWFIIHQQSEVITSNEEWQAYEAYLAIKTQDKSQSQNLLENKQSLIYKFGL